MVPTTNGHSMLMNMLKMIGTWTYFKASLTRKSCQKEKEIGYSLYSIKTYKIKKNHLYVWNPKRTKWQNECMQNGKGSYHGHNRMYFHLMKHLKTKLQAVIGFFDNKTVFKKIKENKGNKTTSIPMASISNQCSNLSPFLASLFSSDFG